MQFTTPSHRIGLKALLLCMALGLLLAGPALAASSRGEGLLEAKNSEAMTLLVNNMLIRVTDKTRVYDGDDKRITFAQIPDPSQVTSTVIYKGRRTIEGMIAIKLVVQVTPH